MLVFFFNDTATTEIYTLSLHDALPILGEAGSRSPIEAASVHLRDKRFLLAVDNLEHLLEAAPEIADRKSTRLNSSHANISYAVFCLKNKTETFTCKTMDTASSRPWWDW